MGKYLFGKTGLVIIGMFLLAGGVWGASNWLPFGLVDAEEYFRPLETRKLQDDEIRQLKSVTEIYRRLSATGDEFEDWPRQKRVFWKYAIAFSSYGLPSGMLIAPEEKNELAHLMSMMILKMKSKWVWGDFTEWGFGTDPITFQNIMYKGHLNLMYGLYQLSTGDTRYAREYTWLTNQIVEEMRLRHQGTYEGTSCEPDHWFVECNMIGLFSLVIYDRLYGTDYRNNEVQWTLDFIKDRMVDPETGLWYRQYHPSHDAVDKRLLGYVSAWTITFMNAIDPAEAKRAWPAFKQHLVAEYGPYAAILGEKDGEPDETAHMFGLWAAKEMGDVALYNKLRNATDVFGNLRINPKTNGMEYDVPDGHLLNGVALATKMHTSWKLVLEKRGADSILAVPDITGMEWTDLLPDRLYRLDVDNVANEDAVKACPSCYWGDYIPPSIHESSTALEPKTD